MFERVLVPLDGSVRAERALPVAARIARASGGNLLLVHVRHIDSSLHGMPQPLVTEARIREEITAGEAYLANVACSPEIKDLQVGQVVLSGPVAMTLLSAIAARKADLVVLCSHGRTGLQRWALGSVAEKIAMSSPVPVLILRDGGPLPLSAHPETSYPLTALVPLDGSVHAKAALEPAANLLAALAAPSRGVIHVLRVVNPPSSTATEQDNIQQDSLKKERYLHGVKAYLRSLEQDMRESLVAPAVARLKLMMTWSVAIDADVAHAIIRVAENGEDAEGAGVFGGCQVIVMATHGRSGLQRWAMGSITLRVLYSTKLPLLIVRPTEAKTLGAYDLAKNDLVPNMWPTETW